MQFLTGYAVSKIVYVQPLSYVWTGLDAFVSLFRYTVHPSIKSVCALTAFTPTIFNPQSSQNSTYSYAICFNSMYYLFCPTLFSQTASHHLGNLALEVQISIESYSASSSTLDGGMCSNVVTTDRLNPPKKTKTVFPPQHNLYFVAPLTFCIVSGKENPQYGRC